MKTINFYDYAKNAIEESIKALGNHEDVKNYYGDSEQCTIESYFASQISGGNVYDHFEEYTEEFLIGSVEDLTEDFEKARKQAYQDYLDSEE